MFKLGNGHNYFRWEFINMKWESIRNEVREWIKEAEGMINDLRCGDLVIESKSHAADLVTNVDQQIEQFFIKKIKASYPTHEILGEEGYGDRVESLDGVVWIIDPIDGTMNFVHMQRHFAISIGIYHEGEGILGFIYDVDKGELYEGIKGKGAYLNDTPLPKLSAVPINDALVSINTAWVLKEGEKLSNLVKDLRGTRSIGSAAIELAYVASGRIDGYITYKLSPWDFAAGKVIIEEVGGVISTTTGTSLNMLKTNTVFAAKAGLHSEVLNGYLIK